MQYLSVSSVVLLVLVLIAAVTDIRRGKIYNWTTYPGMLFALALNAAGDFQAAPCNHGAAVLFVFLAPDNDVANTCFILKRNENHAFCRSRSLPHQYQTGHNNTRTVRRCIELIVGHAGGRAWPG